MPYEPFSSKFDLDIKEQYQEVIKANPEPVVSIS